jgi:hypothetical protein
MHSARSIRTGSGVQPLRARAAKRSVLVEMPPWPTAPVAAVTLPSVRCRADTSGGPDVAKHPFLSDEWFAIVEQLVEEHGADAPAHASIVMNLTVTETPFGDERHLHMGAKEGRGPWGIGHVPDADVTLTTDYATAKEVFVSGDPAAGMQAFMAGKVKVQGDMAKLMAAQAGGAGPGGSALAEAIQGITE